MESGSGARLKRAQTVRRKPKVLLPKNLEDPHSETPGDNQETAVPNETTPLLHGHCHNCRDFVQQVNAEADEQNSNNCCTTIYNCYENCATKFRNSAFMYVLQVLFCLIPFSAIVMGVSFLRKCRKTSSLLPGVCLVLGVFGLLVTSGWMGAFCRYRRGLPVSHRHKVVFLVLLVLLAFFHVIDAVLVLCLKPSFDPKSEDYCDKSFYDYAFYKQFVTLAAVFLAAIIYIPGSRHYLCCQDCSARARQDAFYCSC